jgi:nitroreductase
VRTGDLRDELARICLDQALGAEAAYVVVSAVPGAELDDRGYREAQLGAGVVEGRLHLAAYALGIGATGMTFLDSEVPALLDQPDDLVTLLFTCVGVPEYRTTSGGRPGAPVEIVTPQPRMG